jgi:hypothetical protein
MPAAVGHKAHIAVPNTDQGANSQTAFILHRLIQTSTRPFEWTLSANSPAQDTTGMAAVAPIVRTQRSDGLAEWSATTNGYYPKVAPLSGHVGNVTFAEGNDTCVESFTLDFAYEAFDTTCMGSTAPVWKLFQVGLGSGTGTYRCRVSDAEALTLVGQTGSGTFRIANTSTPCTIIGSIHINSASVVSRIGEVVMVDYSFTFNANVVFAGGADDSLLANTTSLVEPQETEINLWTAGTSEGFNGRCFLTGLSISAAIGSPIEVSISIQGTGALTAA